jgi:glycosyltransferase involved in cell wall biosynthesis
VAAVKPSNDLGSRIHRFRRRRAARKDIGHYTLAPGIDLFSDDRTEFAADPARAIRAMGPVDAITLHWVAGFLDYEGFFANYPGNVPLVWRLADMAALTGGCHYDGGCGKFADRCGACPQLNSRDENDLSRQIWLRKKASLDRVGPAGLHLVATSQWIASQARRSSLLGKFPVTVIPNGLNTDDFAPRDKAFARDTLGVPPGARVVLSVADSVDNVRKGFKYVAEAMKGVAEAGDNVVLLSLGVGRPEIGGGVKNIHLGTIKNDRLLSLVYSAADVYTIASLQESFGQTVIESMACGTPVVGFASGGIVDMVRPGTTGYLAPTGDASALRDAVLRAVRDDDATRRGMAENCRRVALEEYSLDVQSRSYTRLYETLVNGKTEGGGNSPAPATANAA